MNPLLHVVSARNALDLALRNRITWSPRAYETSEAKPTPLADERDLLLRYRLASSRDRMTAERWSRNRTVLEHLDRTLSSSTMKRVLANHSSLRLLDVGCKNFDYVDALAAFWRLALAPPTERSVDITGIELDAHRRYTDFRTRRAWGEHYCSQLTNARYLCGDVQVHQGRYDAITWFFPFVTEVPLLKWGLPLGAFRPRAVLEAVLRLLSPEGVLVVVNHTASESVRQHDLLRELGRHFESLGGEKPLTLVSP